MLTFFWRGDGRVGVNFFISRLPVGYSQTNKTSFHLLRHQLTKSLLILNQVAETTIDSVLLGQEMENAGKIHGT